MRVIPEMARFEAITAGETPPAAERDVIWPPQLMAGHQPPTAAAVSIITPPEVVVITLNNPADCELPVVMAPAVNVMTWVPTGRTEA